jgi:hypothetical protein
MSSKRRRNEEGTQRGRKEKIGMRAEGKRSREE